MPKLAHCFLSTKDFTALETLLEHEAYREDAFLRLLRNKLSTATVMLQEDMGPDIATIDSRIDYVIDGRQSDSRILVVGRENTLSRFSLPITTLRGLALLGLIAGDTVTVARPEGGVEELHLERVAFQPEADRRERLLDRPAARAEHDGAPSGSGGGSVVAFSAWRKPAPAATGDGPPPDDDDPGPRAA
ncbi:MAG TPA: nucleoside-diphosphate kinase [Hyphomicrobium sp.]|nr:nucleoside-diphosphate kinase [Hyphomicrobium sp.]